MSLPRDEPNAYNPPVAVPAPAPRAPIELAADMTVLHNENIQRRRVKLPFALKGARFNYWGLPNKK